jgi:hypothetical protein
MVRFLRGIIPATKLERDLALQSVLSAFATGSFLTGTARVHPSTHLETS